MTIKINLELVTNVFVWANSHPLAYLVAWYLLAIPLIRYFVVWDESFYEDLTEGPNAYFFNVVIWLFSPLILPLVIISKLVTRKPR